MAKDAPKDHLQRPANGSQTVEQLNAILNGSVFAIITIDESGIISLFNTAAVKMFGYSASEVVGQDVNILMPDPYASEHRQYVDNYIATGKKKIIDTGRRVVGRRKSGEEFPIHLTVSEAHVSGKRLFTGMIQDISAQVELEHKTDVLRDRLHHVGRVSAMGELVSALAHEVNQPLTAIINFASAARRTLESNEIGATKKATDYILQAGDEALRAGEIIRRLRSFVELGETERQLQDIVFPIKEAVQLSLVGDDAKSIRLMWEIEDGLPKVSIDRVQMQQVFQNLIRNAADVLLNQSGDRIIKIGIKRPADDHIVVSVEDNGPGLDPSIRERIFLPFVTTKRNGMGIGLSISRTIVEAHGGQIYLEQPESNGGRFCVKLPILAGTDNANA